MKMIKFLLAGCFFGIILVKSEAVSWYRIFEMFQFHSFHMYGIIGSAVTLGVIATALIKKAQAKDFKGEEITFSPKKSGVKNYLFGGIIFGLGWALVGACPGPMFALLGYGFASFIIVILGSILGTFVFGVIKKNLPF